MFEIVKAGGIVMVPIIMCSILAVAITLERLWTLLQGAFLGPAERDRIPHDFLMSVGEAQGMYKQGNIPTMQAHL
ncbi:MAG: hypothetical protein MUO39_12680, partial [Steroidobacteraceae bacterium]|nr:hypothetical protein [Steroidobacteraceae bacterium]